MNHHSHQDIEGVDRWLGASFLFFRLILALHLKLNETRTTIFSLVALGQDTTSINRVF